MKLLPKMSRQKALAFATACMMSSIPSYAQEDDDFDLGEVFNLNMEVTVASKKAEKISDAPGMIVAYSDKDMKILGYNTIRDLASITAGFSTFHSIGEITLETRGQKTAGYDNNKHLLMVDGIPVRQLRAGKVPVEEEINLFSAKRVEFLKGPGSALYGTGAFNGVINVISQSPTENGAIAQGRMSIGSDNLAKQLEGFAALKNDNGTFRISASMYDKETQGDQTAFRGTRSYYQKDSANADTSFAFTRKPLDGYENWSDKNAQYINLNYTNNSGFGTGFIYSRKQGGLGEYWWQKSSKYNDLTWELMIPYFKFAHEFSDKFSFNSYLLANQSLERGFDSPEGDYPEEYARKDGSIEALTEGSFDFGNAGSLITGINYDVRTEFGTNTISSGSYNFWPIEKDPVSYETMDLFNTLSFYAQYQKDFPVLSGLKLTAGLREDIGFTKTNHFSQLSPRVGLVQKFTDKLNFKVLYGQALRAPGIKEVGTNLEATHNIQLAGGTNYEDPKQMDAENIKSLETSVNVNYSKLSATVAGFINQTEKPLGRIASIAYTDSTNQPAEMTGVYGNGSGYVRAAGFEADLALLPTNFLKVGINGSYAIAKDSSKVQMDGVPTGKMSTYVSFLGTSKLPLTVTPIYTNIFSYRMGGKSDNKDNFMKENGGKFYTVDLNTTWDPFKHIGFEMMIKNLTNNRFYQPGIELAEDHLAETTTYKGNTVNIVDAGIVDLKNTGTTVKLSIVAKF